MVIFKTYIIVLTLAGRTVAVDSRPECEYSLVQIGDECPNLSGTDWEVFGEELYKGRGLVFAGDKQASIRRLHQLLGSITSPDFFTGFECPLATTSAFYSLAVEMASAGRLRRAQALLLMGFVFVRDKGFYDCSPWPVHGWDMLLAGRFIRDKIREIDDQSVIAHTPKQLRAFNPADIAIVCVCAYPDDQPIKRLSRENHQLYAQIHGYSLYQFESEQDIAANEDANMTTSQKNPFFWKVNAVRNVIEKHSWVMWMDCDAFFMDPERTIDSVIEMYTANQTLATRVHSAGLSTGIHAALYPGGGTNVSLLLAVDSTGINNGVWMMRNSGWSSDFLLRWWNSPILQGKGVSHNCSDQSTMQHELLYDNMMRGLSDEVGRSWDDVEAPLWPLEVRVVPQEHIQSFHKETADSVLSREWVEGDFVKHHPGCHYYKQPCQIRFAQAHDYFIEKVRTYVLNN